MNKPIEKPILMTGVNVCAILEGRKTQTRRIIKNPEYFGCFTGDCTHSTQVQCDDAIACWSNENCPHPVGSRIWVKETHLLKNAGRCVVYRADMDPVEAAGFGAMYGGWKPSIFMRRVDSRIELEVTKVRVERLKEISADDARKEGVSDSSICLTGKFPTSNYLPRKYFIATGDKPSSDELATANYCALWESINGIGSWNLNELVRVYEFRRVKP